MKNIKVVMLKENGKVVEEYIEEKAVEEVEIFAFEKDPYEAEDLGFYSLNEENNKNEKMVEFYY
jgi:hypothetical protein